MKSLRFIHTAVGVLAILAFVLSGQYMDKVLGHLRGMPDTPRLLLRSSHIYLLFSALLNVLLGLVTTNASTKSLRWAQALGSIAVIVAPFLLIYSFFNESHADDLTRPIATLACYLALAGVLCQALARWLSRQDPRAGDD